MWKYWMCTVLPKYKMPAQVSIRNFTAIAITGIYSWALTRAALGRHYRHPVHRSHSLGKGLRHNKRVSKKQELSSVFMYEMINAYGGAELFYKRFYITAVSPLGFVKNGRNLNYYDDKILAKR